MIVVTTPTGKIGSAVVESLQASGSRLRLITREPTRLPLRVRENAEVVPGSHADPAVLDRALAGADALFVLVPPDFAATDVTEQYLRYARPIAAAVRTHGLPRVVSVSSLGRGYSGPAGQLSAAWAMDDALEATGAPYRSLQPAFFMENLLHQTTMIRDRGTFTLTGDPDEPHAMVAVADIAATAAALLADPSWTDQQGVTVREPDDHTPRELAALMSQILGRPVTYHQNSLKDYRSQLASRGASAAVIDAMIEMAEAQRDRVYPPATGRPATSFAEWCSKILLPAMAGD